MTRSGIDLSALDPDVRPQDDLYAHVNGRWLAAHVIPADRAMDGAFRALHDQAEEQDRDIITDAGASAAAGTSTDPVEAKVGAVYASFMDTDAVEAAGIAPLRTDLALVEAATTQAELTGALGALQRTGAGGAVGFYVDNDAKEPTRYAVTWSRAAWACRTRPTTATSSTRRCSRRTARTSPACCAWAAPPLTRRRPTSSPVASWPWRPSWPPGTGTS